MNLEVDVMWSRNVWRGYPDVTNGCSGREGPRPQQTTQGDKRDKEEEEDDDDDLSGVDQTSIFQARKTVNSSS